MGLNVQGFHEGRPFCLRETGEAARGGPEGHPAPSLTSWESGPGRGRGSMHPGLPCRLGKVPQGQGAGVAGGGPEPKLASRGVPEQPALVLWAGKQGGRGADGATQQMGPRMPAPCGGGS